MPKRSKGEELARALKKQARARSKNLSQIRALARRFGSLRRYDTPQALDLLVAWTRARFLFASADRAIFGASGGVDSSLVACILSRALPGRVTGYLLPARSSEVDEADAVRLLKLLRIKCRRVELSPAVDALCKLVSPADTNAIGNLKTRLRTAALFHEAAATKGLFVGTGDLDEGFVGYYTKGSGSDLSPIGSLHKSEVRALLYLGLERKDRAFARRLSRKPADAGLVPGKCAEAELGVRYPDIERALGVILSTCDLTEVGVIPREPDGFEWAFKRSGLSVGTFQKVADLIFRARHKAATPALWRADPQVSDAAEFSAE